ncbi:MAG: lytic transglycosylase domain-containing protein [Eubacteriales bacterium]|nr:lytic transglycosylase domain-containing protein [Eubacteriales bacterium]
MKKLLTVFIIIALFASFVYMGGMDRVLEIICPFDYKLEISKGAATYNLDPYLVAAVVKTESNFDKTASSGVAHGLMQITDTTAEYIAERTDYDFDRRFEPGTNIMMGCYYLSYLKERFSDTDTALAAYNAGPATVDGWLKDARYSTNGKTLDIIPYKETKDYIVKIKLYKRIYERLYKIS